MKHKFISIFLIVLSLIIVAIFCFKILQNDYTFWNSNLIFDKTGQVGDFIGGVVGTIISAGAFFLLYLTFSEQRNSFEKERFESKFFDLLKLHRDNVSEMKFNATGLCKNNDSLFIENISYEGKSVFKVIFNQFIMCKNELQPFMRKNKMFKPEYEDKLKNNSYIKENNINIIMLAKIDICYSIVFYGLSSEGILILSNNLKKKYKAKFVNDILRYISLKPAKDEMIYQKWKVVSSRNTRGKRNKIVEEIYNWRKKKTLTFESEFNDTIEGYHNRYIKYYGGHQFRLGHYYRHLFQLVKYVNKQSDFTYSKKYDYIKILRAQLSTYEQAVLFINSLSSMGLSWELIPEVDIDLKNYTINDFELITKYNLIKNITGESLYGIKFKNFYPHVNYENDSVKKDRYFYK